MGRLGMTIRCCSDRKRADTVLASDCRRAIWSCFNKERDAAQVVPKLKWRFCRWRFFDIGSRYGHCPGPLTQVQNGPSERTTTGGSANARGGFASRQQGTHLQVALGCVENPPFPKTAIWHCLSSICVTMRLPVWGRGKSPKDNALASKCDYHPFCYPFKPAR